MGSRRTGDGVERVYAAASEWVDRTLRADDSLFTPGKAIWSSRWLGELRGRFLEKPDESKENFLVKLQKQLTGSPPEVYQLMAEALYVYFLIVSTQSAASESRVINTVLAWSPVRVTIPENLVGGLTPGICTSGQFFHSGRPFQVSFLVEFAEQWKEKGPDEHDRLLVDPWAFQEFVTQVKLRSEMLHGRGNAVRAQQLALLHLVFPDTFEGIVSYDHKRMISQAFKSFVTEPTDDVDRMLAQIRPRLEEEHGRGIHFYEDAIYRQWDTASPPNPNLWDEIVTKAKRYAETGKLDSEEVDYKLEIGRKLAEAREAVLDGVDDWGRLVNTGMTNSSNNLIHYIQISKFHGWMNESSDDALIALQTLWTRDDASVAERVREFCGLLPRSVASGSGIRTNVVSVLLMGLDAQHYPPFTVTVFEDAYKLTDYELPEKDADEAALYEHALGFLDRFMEEAENHGLSMRHPLDAQSYVWGILKDRGDDGDGDEGPESTPLPSTDP